LVGRLLISNLPIEKQARPVISAKHREAVLVRLCLTEKILTADSLSMQKLSSGFFIEVLGLVNGQYQPDGFSPRVLFFQASGKACTVKIRFPNRR
tara:strand:- start:1145 stop:1429 length:285 start_codon:yes stop_codon:yes gene_type:complete